MSFLESLDKTTAFAHDALHQLKRARARLTDIHPKEVSLVDRAANKRRFLMVKHFAEGDVMGTETKTPDTQKPSDTPPAVLSLTASTKEELAKSVAPLIEQLVSVAHQIKDATVVEKDDAVSAGIPEDLKKSLQECGQAISKLCGPVEEPTPEPAGPLAKALASVSELAKKMAGVVGDAEEVPEAMSAQFSEVISALTKLQKQAPADPEPAPVADPEPAPADPPAAAPTHEATTKSDEKFDALKASIEALTATVREAFAKKEEPEAPKADDAMAEAVAKAEALAKENAELKARLEKAEEDPPVRASTPTPTEKNDDTGPRVFPVVYGDPIHDPQPTAGS